MILVRKDFFQDFLIKIKKIVNLIFPGYYLIWLAIGPKNQLQG